MRCHATYRVSANRLGQSGWRVRVGHTVSFMSQEGQPFPLKQVGYFSTRKLDSPIDISICPLSDKRTGRVLLFLFDYASFRYTLAATQTAMTHLCPSPEAQNVGTAGRSLIQTLLLLNHKVLRFLLTTFFNVELYP